MKKKYKNELEVKMDFDKILNLEDENKIKLLKQIIENDLSYWKKILILISIKEKSGESKLIETIINNKRMEMEIFYKEFNIEQTDDDLFTQELNFNAKENIQKLMGNIITNNKSVEYKIACTQTLEILKHIPKSYYNKINNNFISRLEQNVDPIYKFNIDNKVAFSELDITKDTEDLLLLISDKFWKNEGKQIYIEDIFTI